MDNQAGRSGQGREKRQGLGIGRRQGTGRMVAIGEVEVKPQTRHEIRPRVGPPVVTVRRAVGALEGDTEIERGLLAMGGGQSRNLGQGGVAQVQPCRAQPALAGLRVDMGGVRVRARQHKIAVVNVRIEQRKELVDVGRRDGHRPPPSWCIRRSISALASARSSGSAPA